MIGLALEGGGSKGSYQAGAYMALKKCGVKVNAVAGTSIGSLNGALIAAHEEAKMVSLWRDATMTELLGIDEYKAHEILKSGLSLDKIKISFTELYKVFQKVNFTTILLPVLICPFSKKKNLSMTVITSMGDFIICRPQICLKKSAAIRYTSST